MLAIIDTGAEMSLLRKSIADDLRLTLKESKFDLMSLSNMAIETFGEVDTRVEFAEGRKQIYAQAHFSVVPDVIFDTSIGALLGMDILKPLKTTIALDPFTITLNNSHTTLTKSLVDVRGIRTRDQTMAAVMAIMFKERSLSEIYNMVHDIIERRTELNEIPIIDSKIINVTVDSKATTISLRGNRTQRGRYEAGKRSRWLRFAYRTIAPAIPPTTTTNVKKH